MRNDIQINMSIYIIQDKFSDNCYIGSTKDLYKRIIKHKSCCDYSNLKLYTFIRENGGWNNFELVEICKCDIDKLREMEQYHIDFVKPSLNQTRAYGRQDFYESQSLYYANNREKSLKKVKEYRLKNKDKIKEWGGSSVECECGKTYTKTHKARHVKSKYHLSHPRPHSPRQT